MNRTWASDKVRSFETSIFDTISRLAIRHRCINFGQGFPDFDAPNFIKQAAIEAIRAGHNQYAPPHGTPVLRQAIAAKYATRGLIVDPDEEITVTAGSTEAMFATLSAICNPGDEWILFEPTYDTYEPIIRLNGGTAVGVRLHSPDFAFDPQELEAAFGAKTRGIILNSPHNPTSRVFNRGELEWIRDLCVANDCLAITDEVYEHLVFGCEHISLATLSGMRDRTVTISSTAKSFSATGWKIGYAVAPPEATRAIRKLHQYVIFTVATPFQHAMARGIGAAEQILKPLLSRLSANRRRLLDALRGLGFDVLEPQGTFFMLADCRALRAMDDVDFVSHLIQSDAHVATIPVSVFYLDRDSAPKRYIRFCFAKRDETIERGLHALERLKE